MPLLHKSAPRTPEPRHCERPGEATQGLPARPCPPRINGEKPAHANRRSIRIAAAILGLLALPAKAQICAPINFPPGQETTTREDHVPKDLPLCYDFAAHAGQTVTLRVIQGDDMNLGLDSVAPGGATHAITDSRTAYTLQAEETTYRVYVASRKPTADTTKTFVLTISRH